MKTMELERVRRHTSARSNRRIDESIAATIEQYSGVSDDVLTHRIRELDRAWDIERTLQTNASILALLGIGLGSAVDRRWLALSGGVLGFLLLHGTQGWCPPLPLFRRLGVRTRSEIERERFALKFLRGDFDDVRKSGRIDLPALIRALQR
jgi:hypothetical protein